MVYGNGSRDMMDDMLEKSQILIHQMVFFLDLDHLEVFESYQVRMIKMVKHDSMKHEFDLLSDQQSYHS